MNELLLLVISNLIATVIGLPAIFLRIGRHLEKQNQHGDTLNDHEERLRHLEHGR
jgi:hypothetical protein